MGSKLIDDLLKGKEDALKLIDAVCADKGKARAGKEESQDGRLVVLTEESARELITELKAQDRFRANSLARGGKKIIR